MGSRETVDSCFVGAVAPKGRSPPSTLLFPLVFPRQCEEQEPDERPSTGATTSVVSGGKCSSPVFPHMALEPAKLMQGMQSFVLLYQWIQLKLFPEVSSCSFCSLF